MPAALLKVLALSGVISAGCFAVWKANDELASDKPQTDQNFTNLDGEPASKTGIGSDPLPETDPKVTDKSKITATSAASDSQELEDGTSGMLALAEHEFAQDQAPESAQEMPAEFPAVEQTEPEVSAAQQLTESPEPTALEPGVASLEALEAEQNVTAPEPTPQEPTPIRAASAEVSAAPRAPRKITPQKASEPILMPVPARTAASTPTPTRSPGRIIPANAEMIDEQAEPAGNDGPIAPGNLLPDEVTEPAPRMEIRSRGSSTPTPAPRTGMQISPLGSRSRGSSIPTEAPSSDQSSIPSTSTSEPSTDNPFELGGPETGASSIPADPQAGEPTSIPESNGPVENLDNPFENNSPNPASAGPRNRGRVDVPEPVDSTEEPAPFSPPPGRQPARTPTTNHAVGETPEINPATGLPQVGNPRKSTIPSKPVSDNLLIGEGTIDDPGIAQTQQPQIRIEKRAPAEAEIGEKMIYEIVVQNVGQVPAHSVVVEERIPKGTKMESSRPQAKLGRDKIVHWELGTIAAGESQTIKVQVIPLEPGPVGSVATVRFTAQVATKTVVTAPTLSLNVEHPAEVAQGEQVPIRITVKNDGTAVAKKAIVRAQLFDDGLTHPAGRDLDKALGNLAPGQTQTVDLMVNAREEGRFSPKVTIVANGVEQDNKTLDLNVIRSRLTLSREGHVERFVNRPAEFKTIVTNHSIESLRDVHVVETLPPGVVPVGEKVNYTWNPKTRTIEWVVAQLSPGHQSERRIQVVSDHAGEMTGKVEAYVGKQLRAELPTSLSVKGFSALKVDIYGDDKPVAVDEQVSMRVTVSNRGSAPAKEVQTQFELPPNLNLVQAQGPVEFEQDGRFVTFASMEELAPNEKKEFEIVLVAAQQGNSKVAVEVCSEDRKNDPVRQEEPITITP